MKKRIFSWVSVSIVSLLALGAKTRQDGNVSKATYTSQHQDYRETVFLEVGLDVANTAGLEAKDFAIGFLKTRTNAYGLKNGMRDLRLESVRQSLRGTHYHFQQVEDETLVREGEVIVSIDNQTNHIYQSFNNYLPIRNNSAKSSAKAQGILSVNRAYDIAWKNLRVQGKLQDKPRAKTMYLVDENGNAQLAYITYLNVSEPFGAWEHAIDAITGKIISRRDIRLERTGQQSTVAPELIEHPAIDRAAAFAEYTKRTSKPKILGFNEIRDGKGLVFDPDPRTSLQDDNLQDDSEADKFAAAYFLKTLPDLSFDGSKYSLEGPYVTISDFESPSTEPSTSTTGEWDAKRGSNAFNDAMTYFHIDQSQRYMQSLGFTGDKSIQGDSIAVDSDGLGGADNSHFIPGSNRLAFGHGCVDDNEDADVILHEYGHAINWSINRNWGGGDMGAMGEGFGDYWAGSYSLSTANGKTYNKAQVFNWDAHGTGNKCWPGRNLDATEMQYDPNKTYGAHSPIGRRASDELWSTPLFQALLATIERGGTRENFDQIILEAQFGLGARLKMRDLAETTIATARRLYPNQVYADALLEKFAAQNIVTMPRAEVKIIDHELQGLGENGYLDPGESATVRLKLANQGNLDAASIKVKIKSASTGVTVGESTISLPNLAAGAEVTPTQELDFSVDENLGCGSGIDLQFEATFSDTAGQQSSAESLSLKLGKPNGIEASDSNATPIPDDDMAGIVKTFSFDIDGVVSENLAIDINLEHSYIGDLDIVLQSPQGTKVSLHERRGGSSDSIVGRYPTTLTPFESLEVLYGEPLRGTWKIIVKDTIEGDDGVLNSIGITDIAGFSCSK